MLIILFSLMIYNLSDCKLYILPGFLRNLVCKCFYDAFKDFPGTK